MECMHTHNGDAKISSFTHLFRLVKKTATILYLGLVHKKVHALITDSMFELINH